MGEQTLVCQCSSCCCSAAILSARLRLVSEGHCLSLKQLLSNNCCCCVAVSCAAMVSARDCPPHCYISEPDALLLGAMIHFWMLLCIEHKVERASELGCPLILPAGEPSENTEAPKATACSCQTTNARSDGPFFAACCTCMPCCCRKLGLKSCDLAAEADADCIQHCKSPHSSVACQLLYQLGSTPTRTGQHGALVSCSAADWRRAEVSAAL